MKASAPIRWPRLLPAAGFAACVGGCASLESVAPPVSPAMVGVSRGATPATLETGRRILTTRCAACHKVYPVAAHSASGWQGIVEDMARRTKLNLEEKAAVTAYLAAACTLPPPAPAPGGS